jgi:hypothetical protein
MIELLRDPVWQFVGAALALVAIFVSLYSYLKQRPKKRLVVEKRAVVPLVSSRVKHFPGLEVLFNREPIEFATVLAVRVRNTGNSPILPQDYENAICLKFDQGVGVLAVEIKNREPENLSIEAYALDGRIDFSKCLLNPGDHFECVAVLKNTEGDFEAHARIAGVAKLETTTHDFPSEFVNAMSIALFSLSVSALAFGFDRAELSGIQVAAVVVTAGIGTIIAALARVAIKKGMFEKS